MSTLGRGSEISKSHLRGCPGALGKLASNNMFRTLLGSSWPGVHKHDPEVDFSQLLGTRLTGLETLDYERPGWRPS